MREHAVLQTVAVVVTLGLGGCGSPEHDHADQGRAGHDRAGHDDGASEPADPEVAALRAAARRSMADTDSRRPWDPREAQEHDHGDHGHGDHDGHDHGEHGDHDGHEHGDHGAHGDEADDAGHSHHGEEGHARDDWLPRRARWIALEGEPEAQWDGRFGPNVALEARRPFALTRLRFVGHVQEEAGFEPHEEPALVEAGDALKLVATTTGLFEHGDHAHALGPLFVYLRRRDDRVERIVSPQPLATADLIEDTVTRYLRDEPVTFLAYHPTRPREVVVLERLRMSVARGRIRFLRRVLDRAGLAAVRAAGGDAAAAEERVREVYAHLDPEHPAGVEPLVVEAECAGVLLGALRPLRFRKELGLE